jgi:hypothetical protein
MGARTAARSFVAAALIERVWLSGLARGFLIKLEIDLARLFVDERLALRCERPPPAGCGGFRVRLHDVRGGRGRR